MRSLAALGPVALAGLVLHASAVAAADGDVRIAILADGPSDRNPEILEIFQSEMLGLLGDEFGVEFPEGSLVEADWTLDGVRAAIDGALADPDVDVVLGLGLLVSNELCRRETLRKPVVAPFVIDPYVQGIPFAAGVSGVPNLCYVTSVSQLRRDLEAFREVVDFERLALLVSDTSAEAIPGLPDRARRIGGEIGLEITIVPVGLSGKEALAAIPPDVEAVYVGPLLRVPDPEFDVLVAGLIERRLPSFSFLGRSEVERGILAGLTPESEFPRLARRTALNIQRILLGEDAGALPVHFPNQQRLSLNVATAREIDVRPTWAVLTVADQVDRQRREVSRRITLTGVVREAVTVNLDLATSDRTVAAGAQAVNVARSSLLPQVEVSALGLLLDEDQARASFGQVAERTLSGTARVSQLLYSDDAWANLGVQRHVQISREREREQLRLDIAQQAATAYLNVLRAQTIERVQKENLERTLANWELAKVRESIGYSGPGEVYRWEGEIARQRQSAIDANSQRNLAEISLNRLLNRPLEEAFEMEDTDLRDPNVGIADPRLRRYLEDPWSFRILREFMSLLSVENSPEVQTLDELIAAQERTLVATKRSFWVPTVGLSGEVSHTFDRQGEGSDPASGPIPLPAPEDTKWNLGVQASLPLFHGGLRIAEKRRAQQTLEELRRRRAAVAEKVEQRLRTAMHTAGASWAGIELSRASSDAARKNLDLVLDAYSKGVVSILDLLDAQNTALVAGETAANAVYDFLIDLLEIERAAGYLSCLGTGEEHDEIVGRLETFREERENP